MAVFTLKKAQISVWAFLFSKYFEKYLRNPKNYDNFALSF
jgi:hypothetical protein